MKGMGLEQARAHLLLRWDKCDFAFNFGVQAAAGGGGGDPGGGGSSALAAVQGAPAPAAAAPRRLDIRTRTFEVQLELMAIASRQELHRILGPGHRVSTWHEQAGVLPPEVLGLIDDIVSQVRYPPISAFVNHRECL